MYGYGVQYIYSLSCHYSFFCYIASKMKNKSWRLFIIMIPITESPYKYSIESCRMNHITSLESIGYRSYRIACLIVSTYIQTHKTPNCRNVPHTSDSPQRRGYPGLKSARFSRASNLQRKVLHENGSARFWRFCRAQTADLTDLIVAVWEL